MGGKSRDSSLQEGASHIYTLRLDYREFLSCINIYILWSLLLIGLSCLYVELYIISFKENTLNMM